MLLLITNQATDLTYRRFYGEILEDMQHIIIETVEEILLGSEKIYLLDSIKDKEVMRISKRLLENNNLEKEEMSNIGNKFLRIVKYNVLQKKYF